MSESVAETLGHFVAESRLADIPPGVLHEAKRSLLNFMGGAIGVAQTAPVETAVKVLAPLSGPAQATLLGRCERVDVLSACFVNAIAANLLDYDDTHHPTIIHPTAPVAPPVLALAEDRMLSGALALHALLLGMEVECRIGNAVSPGHYARGWHITSTCGVFGAAAASARLLGLDAAQTAHAIGLAASQSSGNVENLPSAAKNVSVGNAARNGLFGALLARAGYTAAPASIEGRLGWARACGDEPNLDAITDRLGQHWEAATNTFKPYPCGIVIHPVIDACFAIRARGIDPAAIRSVVVSGPSLLLERGDRVVANERDARVSIHHAAAVALLFGRAGIPEFEPAAVFAPEVVALRGRVRAECDPAIPPGAARVVVTNGAGAVHDVTVTAARGSLERPLSDREIEDKVNALVAANPVRDPAAMTASVWSLEAVTDLRLLLASAASPGAGP